MVKPLQFKEQQVYQRVSASVGLLFWKEQTVMQQNFLFTSSPPP